MKAYRSKGSNLAYILYLLLFAGMFFVAEHGHRMGNHYSSQIFLSWPRVAGAALTALLGLLLALDRWVASRASKEFRLVVRLLFIIFLLLVGLGRIPQVLLPTSTGVISTAFLVAAYYLAVIFTEGRHP